MKCPTCPVASGPCYAEPEHRRRLCRLIASGRDDYRRLVIGRSEGLPDWPPDGDVIPVPADPADALTVGAVLSDRLPDLWPRWFSRIAECVERWRGDRPRPTLALIYSGDRSRWPEVLGRVNAVADTFGDLSLSTARLTIADARRPSRQAILADFLARAYNRLLDHDGGWLWIVEDDVMPPADALARLWGAAGGELAVSGWYRDRHQPERLIAADWPDPADKGTIRFWRDGPTTARHVDAIGTGCILIRKGPDTPRFRPTVAELDSHDWAFAADCRAAGRPILVLPEVGCAHHRTATSAIQAAPWPPIDHPDSERWRALRALNDRVRACPHREACGCEQARCAKYGGFKSYEDCHACPDLPPRNFPT